MKFGFKFGPDPNTAEPHLELGAMTLLVGPNGAGKTLTLRELCRSLKQRWPFISGVVGYDPQGIIHCIHTSDPRDALRPIWRERIVSALVPHVHTFFEGDPRGSLAPDNKLEHAIKWRVPLAERPEDHDEVVAYIRETVGEDIDIQDHRRVAERLVDKHPESFGEFAPLTNHHVSLESRLRALTNQDAHPLGKPPENHLMALLTRPEVLDHLNQLLQEHVGFMLAVDPTAMTTLRAVTYDGAAERPPLDRPPWDPASLEWYRNARPLEERSHGQRLFASLLAEALVQESDFLLIDEPEVALHPALALQLGTILTDLAEERGLSIIAATHSDAFVAGCIATRAPVTICRLDYSAGKGSAFVLDHDTLASMVNRPRLRAAGTLAALFHKAALICEGPPDRVIYSEINHRLLAREKDTYPRLMTDCHFLEYGGMTGIPEPLEMLRACGVRTAAILDLDVLLNDNRRTLAKLARAVGLADDAYRELEAQREALSSMLAPKRPFPLDHDALVDHERAQLLACLDALAAHGLFVCPHGELEDWLAGVGLDKRKKSEWSTAALDWLGPIDSHPPQDGDVWGFMRRVASWLASTAQRSAQSPSQQDQP